MNTSIKTALAAIGLVFAFACKKENINRQPSLTANDASDMIAGKYPHVTIGTQVWMTKNLAVTHYRNGDKIPQITFRARWDTLTTGAWCWYNNDSSNDAVYGKLYNWYAVNDPRGLAPTGWHVPTTLEWDSLSAYLATNVGGKMKDTGTIEAGTGLWHAPNQNANNRSGFTGLPGGNRFGSGTLGYSNIGYYGSWWSSTPYDAADAFFRQLAFFDGHFEPARYYKQSGLSVRCIKD